MVVLEAMALKWLLGKAFTATVTHVGSSAVLTHAGMSVAAGTVSGAGAAGSTLGAAAVVGGNAMTSAGYFEAAAGQ